MTAPEAPDRRRYGHRLGGQAGDRRKLDDTALVGGPDEWEVRAHRSVWGDARAGRAEHARGSHLRLPPRRTHGGT